MISKYGIFCKVIEYGNFTKVAEQLGYSQSAVSQSVKSLEAELGYTLIDRRKDGIRLTADGEQFYPYIKSVNAAETELDNKKREMNGLADNMIRIGTFTGISRNFLPPLIKSFKLRYPQVKFALRQGEYTGIAEWIKSGAVDFGFVNSEAVSGVEMKPLYTERMMAVLPLGHRLAKASEVSLVDLSAEPFILLDEGKNSVALNAFAQKGISLSPAYEVYDDYTIMSMIRKNIGVSLLYERVLEGYEHDFAIRPVLENPSRQVAVAWRNIKTMPKAARLFMSYIDTADIGFC